MACMHGPLSVHNITHNATDFQLAIRTLHPLPINPILDVSINLDYFQPFLGSWPNHYLLVSESYIQIHSRLCELPALDCAKPPASKLIKKR